ncbi:MAG: T9SS C-terminal target domain-containing protein, partial [Bacteroidetes bacterium]
NKFKCVSQHGNVDGGAGTGASPYFKTTTANIADGVAGSTNFGVFSVASATATASATLRSQTNACLIIDLNATAGLESPPGGQWEIVGGFFTAGGPISFTTGGAGLRNGTSAGNAAPWPVIASATSPATVATNILVSGSYQFSWKRFSTECGGSLSSPIDTEVSSFVTVTTGGATITQAQVWNGAIDTNWASCYNWSNWSPDNNGTYDVTINAGASFYPVLPSDFALRSLTINPGGKIDLNGKILTAQTINFNSALITDTGQVPTAGDPSGTTLDGIYSGFITVTSSATIRKSQFDGVFGIEYRGGTATNNGGNRFMSATTIRHIGGSDWKWGWNDISNRGGADVFESDLDVLTQDCGAYNFFRNVPRLGRFNGFNPGNGPTNLATSLPNLGWIQEPFYNPGTAPANASLTGNAHGGLKSLFPDYYRKDNYPTNTSNPITDSTNAVLNKTNAALNRADEVQSLANVVTGNANAAAAYIDADAARVLINNVSQTALNHLTNGTILNFLTGATGVPAATTTALVNAYNALDNNRRGAGSAGCYTGGTNTQNTMTTATTDVNNAYLSSTNPPGTGILGGMTGDNKLANDARIAANAANVCANTTTPLIQALITAINASIDQYNANYLSTFDVTINLSNTNSRLTFAYNTQGTEFKGNTNFTVRNCGELRISEGGALGTATVNLPTTTTANATPANAKFTGAGKAINFINESYANYSPTDNNSYSPYAIWTSIQARTNVSFEGAGATVHIQNRERGGVRINESGTADFKNGTNLVFSNFVSANQMWIGGNGAGISFANLDNGFLSTGTFNRGDVYLRNFRQFGSGFPTIINVNSVARLFVQGLSQFDGNMTITGRRTGNNNVGNGNDGNFLYVANNNSEQAIFNGALRVLNTSTIYTEARIGNRGNVFLNGDTELSNASAQSMGTYFGATLYPRPAVPTSANGYGSVTLADQRTFRIGRAGYVGGGWIALDNFIQQGNTRQNISLPVTAFPYDYTNSSAFVTCANKAGFQPCSSTSTELFVRRSSFDAGIRLEAPALFLRNTVYKDTVYAVVYNYASRNFCCGGMAFNDGESSGGNTFNKKASFEFRGNNGNKWFFGGKNYVSGSIQSASSFASEPDIFRDSLYLFNNGNNTEMAIGYNSAGNVFEGDVIIRNRGRVATDFTGTPAAMIPTSTENRSDGNTAPIFRIGGDPITYTPANSLFPVSRTQGSTLVFNKSLTIINESTRDVMIAAHPSDNITIKGDLIINNRKAPYYTGVDICGINNYRGDVRFISGNTTIESTSNISIGDFPDGELEFTSVTVQGASTDLLNIDLSAKVSGDRGRARITLQKSNFQRRMNVRSAWINFFGSTYDHDASFERTGTCFLTAMGNVHMEGRSGNLFKGTFSLNESSNTNTIIRMATNGNIANVFSGDIYQKAANFSVRPNLTKSIYPAYNYISQFAGDLSLNFATVADLNFTSTSGMEFNGVGNQALSSPTRIIMSKVFVNQSKGSTITPNNSFDINSQLFFNYGKILLGSNLATIRNVDNVISVSVQYPNEGHIVANQSGTVNRVVNRSVDNLTFITVLFPIGNLTNYLPVTLAQRQTGTSDQFRARLLDDVYTTYRSTPAFAPSDDPAFDPVGSPTAIDRNFVKRSWIVTEDVVGGTDGAIMIQWFEGGGGVASDEPIGFDRQKTSMVHYNAFSNQWRCMDAVGPVSGPPNIRRGSFALNTTVPAATIEDNKTKMGVFSIGSFTAGEGGNIQTCGAGSAQLSAPVLTPPLYGQWSFVNFASITATFVTSDIPLTVIAAPAGFSFSSINDATALAQGLDANTAYRLRWTALGLDGCNASYADYIVITGAFSNAITNKTLIWQGVDAWFWYCQNWKVQGENYFALPDVTMDLLVPDVNALGTGTHQPVLYDRNVTVKSLTLKANSNFTLFQTASLPIQLTLTNFMTVDANALYNNTQVTTINGNTENAGEIRSFVTAITGATQPRLEFRGNLKNTGIFNQNENLTSFHKDLENSGAGTIFHTAGKVEFVGSTNSFITGGNEVKLFNVDLNKTIASNDKLTLASTNLFITTGGALNFVSGTISSHSAPSWYGGNAIYLPSVYAPSALVFDAGATYAGSDSYKYVTGPVSKIGNTTFEFPIGKGGFWARLALSDLTGATATDRFTAEYFNFQYSNIAAFKAAPSVAPRLTRVSYVEHWQLNRDLGNTQPKVTLFWENGTRSGVGNLTKLYVGHFDSSSQWDNMGGAVSGTSTAAKGSVTSTANFLSFSPTTLATDDPLNNPLPVEWLYVRAKLVQDEEAALVEWATIFEANTDYFEVQKSFDGQIFKAVGIQKAAKNANTVSNYSFLDNNPYSGISYYRIRQVDADGQETFSRIVSVSRNKTAKQSFYVFPSPTVSSNVNLLINSNTDGELTLVLNNTLGEILYSAKIKVEKGENRISINDLNLPNGVYFARLAEYGLISKFEIQQ